MPRNPTAATVATKQILEIRASRQSPREVEQQRTNFLVRRYHLAPAHAAIVAELAFGDNAGVMR